MVIKAHMVIKEQDATVQHSSSRHERIIGALAAVEAMQRKSLTPN